MSRPSTTAFALFVAAGAALAAAGQAPAIAAAAKHPAKPAANLQKGRELFSNYGCGSCHTLAAAGGSGSIGPSLDKDPRLTQALVIDRVTHGQGAMPAFGGQMSDDDIKALAAYVKSVAK